MRKKNRRIKYLRHFSSGLGYLTQKIQPRSEENCVHIYQLNVINCVRLNYTAHVFLYENIFMFNVFPFIFLSHGISLRRWRLIFCQAYYPGAKGIQTVGLMAGKKMSRLRGERSNTSYI